MKTTTRSLSIAAALSTLLFSSTALAWAVPIHKCTYQNPTPVGDPIPCAYTNQDGITFNGVVTVSGNGEVLCTGLIPPRPKDPTAGASFEKLYSDLGDDYGDAPWCAIDGTPEGQVAECFDEPPGGDNPWAAVKVCGDGWCLELSAYDDCNDYYSTEAHIEGVECYDLV